MIISIAIVDSNREYLKRLTEVLQENGELRISIFSNTENLFASMKRERYDVVLFDPDVSEEKLVLSNVKLSVCLYSDEAVNKDLYADFENIHKYQRISNIYKEILKKYADKAGYMAGDGTYANTKLYAVYSPAGGVGKTTISLAMSLGMAELGKKVLYISNEQLSSSSVILPYSEEGVTTLIETLNSGASFEVKLKGVAKQGMEGIDYIEGFQRIADYGDVDSYEMRDLLGNIKKTGMYDYLIVDMESSIDGIAKAVWEEADKIVLVYRQGKFNNKKLELLLNQGIALENEHKFLTIRNLSDVGGRDDQIGNIPCIGKVHNYGNSPEEQVIKTINYNKEIDLSKLI